MALKIQRDHGQKAQEAETLNYLASLAAEGGKATDAEPYYRQALKMQAAAEAHPEAFYITSCKLAEILHDQHKTGEATDLIQDAVQILERPAPKVSAAKRNAPSISPSSPRPSIC